ncbi:MAG: phosphoribosylanthranilate isomerase [Pseudomonadaceae bacterium]|nr:phosphoribosylanthranilate isomerase [Pseudomonadaceae bacterium]
MHRTRVKICCIASIAEAEMAIAAGADALGLVAEMPSGPGPIDDDTIAEIAAFAPPPLATFLLTSRTEADGIIDHANYCGTNTLQIVSHIKAREYPGIIKALPNVRRVQVIHVEDAGAVELIREYEPYVHAFLLDSGRPNAAVTELGGTGRTHDWNISTACVAATKKPVFLAGGLAPDNVSRAINQVKPFGLDLCSGVRSNQQLDATKLSAFMRAVATT